MHKLWNQYFGSQEMVIDFSFIVLSLNFPGKKWKQTNNGGYIKTNNGGYKKKQIIEDT